MDCANCKKNNLIHFESKLGIKYDYPIFSFKYLTDNKKYNFDAIPKNELKQFKVQLVSKILELETKYTTKTLFALRKPKVFEFFNIEDLKFKPNKINYSNDTKIYIFRVTSDYRMICMYSDVAPIFHIIGFDFRFNAYNHGK